MKRSDLLQECTVWKASRCNHIFHCFKCRLTDPLHRKWNFHTSWSYFLLWQTLVTLRHLKELLPTYFSWDFPQEAWPPCFAGRGHGH